MTQWERRELFLRRLDSAEFMARSLSRQAECEPDAIKKAAKLKAAQEWMEAAQKAKVLYNSTL